MVAMDQKLTPYAAPESWMLLMTPHESCTESYYRDRGTAALMLAATPSPDMLV